MKSWEKLFLLVLLIAGFIVRLYRIDNPIADWHSWRQADTSSVSRNFVQKGFDLLNPRFDDISNIASGKDNPEGFRYVEFPIFNLFQAFFYTYIGVLNLEEWGRLTSVFASLASIFFIYSITKKYANQMTGMLAAFFFSFLPYSIYYSRIILPDQMVVTATLGGIYWFDKWLEKLDAKKLKHEPPSWIYFLLSILFTASAFLLKPFALFFTLPLLYLAWKKFGVSLLKKWQLWIFLIVSIVPLVFWRTWIQHHPEGIPASSWLFNGNGIRFRPAFFRWIFYERITKLILGYTGIFFFGFGIVHVIKTKKLFFFLTFLVATLLYICTVATGNVQHDYYQIPIIPTISIFSAIGVYEVYRFLVRKNEQLAILICGFLIFIGFVLSWNQVKDYFNINNRALVTAGKAADKILPKNAKVIAPLPEPQVGDTSFLYYVNRPGWPAFEKPIDELIKMGATHMVLVNPTESDLNGFGKKYKTLAHTKEYLILELK